MAPQSTEGYRRLASMETEDITAVHDEAAKRGETWDFGIRDRGTIKHLADRTRRLAEDRYEPHEIAALVMDFLVSTHSGMRTIELGLR